MNHERMTVYTLANLKGGSGKTTSAVSIAEALARSGRDVLVVDLDPQGTLSRWIASRSGSATALLQGETESVSIESVDLDTAGRVDVVPANRSLAQLDDMRAAKLSKRLEALWDASQGYEYGLIDPPPSVGALVLGALMASDGTLSPVEAGPGAMDGLKDTLQLVNRTGTAGLRGAFACRVDMRTTLDTSVRDGLIDELGSVGDGGRAFETHIREAVAMREAQTAGTPPGAYDGGMTAVADYRDLTDELLTLDGKNDGR
jgi:chromosome partitioning protein